jgi:drug/metabolite transporter (DMT)-like permease
VRAQFPWLALAVLIFAISLGVIGQLLLKLGLNRLGERPSPLLVVKSILTPLIFGGFACYAVSSVFYLQALSRMPLSYAYPMIALSYVGVVVVSWRCLGEDINALRWLGLIIIIVGVVVLALSYGTSAASPTKAP